MGPGTQYDVVHINAEQVQGTFRGTDHDPSVARFFIEAPNEAPTGLVIDKAFVAENALDGTLVGRLSAFDIDEDPLIYSLVDDAGGRFVVDPATGEVRTTRPLDYEGQASYTILARATDPDGLSITRELSIAVTNVNEAPVARADQIAVGEDGTTDNLWDLLLGNDGDPDAGTLLAIQAVDGAGTLGSLQFDAATKTLRYVADADTFDALAPGEKAVDRFTYTVTDGNGLTSTATVTVTVTGIDDTLRLNGGNGADRLTGAGGEDFLAGGNGDDFLFGLDGHDRLSGNNGADQLFGGAGNDLLSGGRGDDILVGGAGSDVFQFGTSGGSDVIRDFDTSLDKLVLVVGIGVKSWTARDVDGDGVQDLTIAFTNGGGWVTLLGVGDLGGVGFGSSAEFLM
jgi:VCBS repeat-containing protein